MTEGPEQEALFQIEGPDEDGCVWACSPEGRDVWCQNLGPKEKVVEVFSEWLEPMQACVGLALSREQLERLDRWIAQQDGDKLGRSEAIRRLLDLLLA